MTAVDVVTKSKLSNYQYKRIMFLLK